MSEPRHNQPTSYAALFVDFDNVYINLAELDDKIADEFATNPDRWLSWLEKQLPLSDTFDSAELASRRILIRRCYLNPQTFSRYRPYFIRSAFEVVDCPPLTTRGKTSTDIHMVMDIMDALSHPTYFREFIILSGDADFTPVLLRIRRHGRYSAVLSVGYVSPAYKAACDYVITHDFFLREALAINYQEPEAGALVEASDISRNLEPLLDRMAVSLRAVAAVPGGVEASALPAVYKEFPEFRHSSNWLGFYSLRRLTEAIILRAGDLLIVEEDPWRVAQRAVVAKIQAAPPSSQHGEVDLLPAVGQGPRPAIANWIRQAVEASAAAVPMSALAQAVSQQFRAESIDADWLGAGSFKGLLGQLDLGPLVITTVIPGYVFDPARHAAPGTPSSAVSDSFASQYPDLAPLARKVHQLTDTPYLMPEHYALLLQELAREINERGYQMTRTSKAVRDRCVEKGAPVARSHVNFVLTGLFYSGYPLGANMPENAARLGATLVQNTLGLCRTAQLELTEAERAQVERWIMGGIPT